MSGADGLFNLSVMYEVRNAFSQVGYEEYNSLIHNLSQLCQLLTADDQTPTLNPDTIKILQVNILGQPLNLQAER